ncbi:MAG: hypothetical protein R2720_03385 [Candidatus Nanopelagicales bacterium]
MRWKLVTLAVAGVMIATATPSASGQELRTLSIHAKGCPNCVVYFGSIQAGIGRRVQLHHGRASIRLPVDAGWYGLTLATKSGMSGGGSQTVVVMNYAGFGAGDKVTNRRSRRAPFGTGCAYFYGPEKVRFVVKRDRLPKRYWGQQGVGPWKKYLRAWASPQQDPVSAAMYDPTVKGSLSTQNAACMYNPDE